MKFISPRTESCPQISQNKTFIVKMFTCLVEFFMLGEATVSENCFSSSVGCIVVHLPQVAASLTLHRVICSSHPWTKMKEAVGSQ